jgi:acetyl esterase/lipase
MKRLSRFNLISMLLLMTMLAVACATTAPERTAIPATGTPVPPTPTAAPAATTTPSSPAEAATLATEVTRQILYANVSGLATHLDVHAPSEPGPWPVVVVVHGGMQSGSHLERLAEGIASQGAVVYNIDVEFTFPHIIGIERIACAVRFARATAADYGGDPSRITLVGNETGASTGAVVALAGDDFEGDCVVMDGSALVDALVGYEGTYDYATTVYSVSMDHTVLEDEDPELWQAINPYSHIGRNPDLQVRLVHGDAVDVLWREVPPEVSIEFHQALVDAGYDVALTVLEGATHRELQRVTYAGGELRFPEAFHVVVQQALEVARSTSR